MAFRYMLLDSRNTTVARGYLESPPESPVWYIRVLDGGEKKVMEHEYLQLVSLDESAPDKTGRLVRCKDHVVILEPIQDLDDDVQQNLRVQVNFDSFIYPLSGKWKGRRKVVSHDLSCGGIAFYCREELQEKEELEIVVPITQNPVVLHISILRKRPSNADVQLYSAKFIDLVREEEALVREAVFGQQIQNREYTEGINL